MILICDINHGVNFFVYSLTGSVFRQALFQLFKCKYNKSAEGHLHEQNVDQNVEEYVEENVV